MQKAEVAGAAVTFGQNVLQDQAQECHAAESAGFHLAGFAVLVAERDVAIAVCNDVLLGQYPAVPDTPMPSAPNPPLCNPPPTRRDKRSAVLIPPV